MVKYRLLVVKYPIPGRVRIHFVLLLIYPVDPGGFITVIYGKYPKMLKLVVFRGSEK